MCASKPAEITRMSGSNARRRGRITSPSPRGIASPPSPASSGALRCCRAHRVSRIAPVPGNRGIWCVEQYIRFASTRISPACRCRDARRNRRPTRARPCRILRMAGGDRDDVEQAESHRPVGLGMMAGWPDGDKGIGGSLPTTSSTAASRRRPARARPPRGSPATSRCRRRAPPCRPVREPRGSPRMRSSGCTSSDVVARRPRRRLRAPGSENCSFSSACSMARRRSGRSGWPGGVT